MLPVITTFCGATLCVSGGRRARPGEALRILAPRCRRAGPPALTTSRTRPARHPGALAPPAPTMTRHEHDARQDRGHRQHARHRQGPCRRTAAARPLRRDQRPDPGGGRRGGRRTAAAGDRRRARDRARLRRVARRRAAAALGRGRARIRPHRHLGQQCRHLAPAPARRRDARRGHPHRRGNQPARHDARHAGGAARHAGASRRRDHLQHGRLRLERHDDARHEPVRREQVRADLLQQGAAGRDRATAR